MADFVQRQKTLYNLLCEASGLQPMLRISRDDDSLWVCDLPRRLPEEELQRIAKVLADNGYTVQHDQHSHLWKIDLPVTDFLYQHCSQLPPIPRKDSLHVVYALLRLMADHPSPVEEQPLHLLRAALKVTAQPSWENALAVQRLHQQCAALLNRRKPLPAAASAALAQYIRKEEQS